MFETNKKYPGKPSCFSKYDENSEFCKKICKHAEKCKEEVENLKKEKKAGEF